MKRALRTRSVKKVKVVTPGGRTVVHFKPRRPSYPRCGNCGAKLNRARLRPAEIRALPKVSRRPERLFPELCASCAREKIKLMVRT